MTEAVLEVYSEAGRLQVTSYGGVSMGLSNYGRKILTDDGFNHPQPIAVGSITITGQYPVLAVSSSQPVSIIYVSNSGSDFTFRLQSPSSVPVTVDWWSFDTPAMAIKTTPRAGLQVWNQYGTMTFDGSMYPMTIVGDRSTPRPTIEYPASPGDFLTDMSLTYVPSGKKYAVVQSTPSQTLTQWELDDDLDWGYPYMYTFENLYSSSYIDGNELYMGNAVFEKYTYGTSTVDTQYIHVAGQTRHVVVDVTHLPQPGGGGASPITVNLTATSRTATVGGAATVNSTTSSVTASVVGGSSPFTYTWQYVDGSTNVVANGATNTNTFSTSSTSQTQGTTRAANWRVKVVDANGSVGYSDPVLFTHVANPYSVSVNTWSWGSPTISTTSNYGGEGSFTAKTIVGPTEAVTLRFRPSAFTGNVYVYGFYVEKNGVAFNNFGIFGNASSSYIDVPVVAGDTVRFWTDAQTLQGAQSGGYTMTVTNQTAPGTPTVASSTFTFNLDTDNNYNRIVPWTTANQVRSSTAEYYGTAIPDKTISGIVSGSRTVRLTMTSLTGNIVSNGIYLFKNGVGTPAATWANGRTVEVTVSNGDTLGVYADASTSDGTRSGSFTLTLTDQSDGSVISTWTNSITVDSDNSSYIDNVPNAVNWPDVNENTTSESTTFGGVSQTFTGINTTITVRVKITARSGTAGASEFQVYKNGSIVAAWSNMTLNSSVDISIVSGDYITLGGYNVTFDGIKTGALTATITNVTTGTTLDTMQYNWTIDSDNSSAPADYTPNSVNWDNASMGPTAEDGLTFATDGGAFKTISGINRTINMRAKITSFSGHAANTMYTELQLYRSGTGPLITSTSIALNNEFTWTATDGQAFMFGGYVVSAAAGRRTGSCTVSVYNDSVSTTTPIDTFTISWDVDTDGSSAPADYTPDSFTWSSSTFSTTSNYDARGAGSRTISGINRTITLRASITSQSGNGQMNAAGMTLYKNGASMGSIEWIGNPSGTVSTTFVNGDTVDIAVDMQSWGAYRATASCTVTLYNVTTSAVVATWTVNGTVFSNKPNA